MKSIVCLNFLLIVSGIAALAQPSVRDSIESVVESEYSRDNTRFELEVLNKLVTHYYDTDPKTSLQYANQLAELAESRAAMEYLTYAYNNKGMAHGVLGEDSLAIAAYQRSLHLARAEGLRLQEGMTLRNLAIVHTNRGAYDKALELDEEALGIFEEFGDAKFRYSAHNGLGVTY